MGIQHAAQKYILSRYVESMPTFSPATAKIIQLANRMNTQPSEIVAAIRLDPVLTGRVLQLVNSAYFSLAQKVTSLNRAVVYLGINTIKNLALSTAVMQSFETKNKELAERIRPTWKHSLATAVCTKLVAKAAGTDPRMLEEFFVAGLLHDIGEIIMIQAFHQSPFPHGGNLSLEQEREIYGQDHCQVGADTLARWKFSDELIAAVGGYVSPPPGNKVAQYLHIADAMSYRLKLNGEPPEAPATVRDISDNVYKETGLDEARVLAELSPAADLIEKAEVFLNIASSKEKLVEVE